MLATRLVYLRSAEIFERVCDLGPGARAEALDLACEGDPVLRKLVEELLASDAAGTEGLLEALAGPAIELPSHIADFEIVGVLGTGGMGVVFEGQQRHPDRRVAIKTVHPRLRSGAARALFDAEVQALGGLLHANIPQVYEAGTDDTAGPFLVMEKVEGLPIDTWVDGLGADREARLELLVQVCDAVQHAHDAGVLHCDLKPENVLVDITGQVKVLDFGVASRRSASGAFDTAAGGTPEAMSPEQRDGGELSERSDVYSLGVLAAYVLTSRRPGAGDEPPPADPGSESSPSTIGDPDLPRDLAGVLARCLDPSPDARPPSAAALAVAFRAARDRRPVPGHEGGSLYRLGLFARRHQAFLVRLAGAALVATLVAASTMGAAWLRADQAEARREAAAAARLRVVSARVRALEAEERHPEAEQLLEASLMGDDVHGTRAWARALLDLARSGAAEPAYRRLAWVYLDAGDASLRSSALLQLCERLSADGRWQQALVGLDLLQTGSSSVDPRTIRRLEAAAAARTRDLGRAREAGSQDPARAADGQILRRLDRTHPSRESATIFRLDLDGDGHAEMVDISGTPAVATRVHELSFTPEGPSSALGTPRVVAVIDAQARLLLAEEPAQTSVWQLAEPGAPARRVATLGRGTALDHARLDWPGAGPTWLLAQSYTHRSLDAVREDADGWHTWTPSAEINAIGSDVREVLVADLDQDGQAEVIVGMAGFHGYSMLVLRPADDGRSLSIVDKLEVGAVAEAVVLRTPSGPQLFVATMPVDTALFEDTDLGQASLWQLAFVDERLRVVSRSSPFGPDEETTSMFGVTDTDLDGDGFDELLVSNFDDARQRWFDPSTSADVTLNGLRLFHRSRQSAGGPQRVAMVMADGTTPMIVGEGDGPMPPITWQPGDVVHVPSGLETSSEVPFDRAAELAHLGLFPEAATAVQGWALLLETSAEQARALWWAARLWRAAGESETATRAVLAGVRAAPNEPWTAELQEALGWAIDTHDGGARALLDALAERGTLTAERRDLRDELSTARAAATHIDLRTGAWPDGLDVHPDAMARSTRDGLEFDAYNEVEAPLRMPLRRIGGPIRLMAEIAFDQMEIGSHLELSLRDDDDQVVAAWEARAYGSGPEITRLSHVAWTRADGRCCGDESFVEYRSAPESVRVSLSVWPAARTVVFEERGQSIRRRGQHLGAVPERLQLVLASTGIRNYKAGQRARVYIRSLTLEGVSATANENRCATAATCLASGQEGRAYELARTEGGWMLVRAATVMGHLEEAEAALHALRREHDNFARGRARRWLRSRPDEAWPVVARVWGPDFPALAAEALMAGIEVGDPETQSLLLRPELAIGDDFERATLRSQAAFERGLNTLAIAEGERALTLSDVSNGATRQLHLRLARAWLGRDVARAQAHVAAYRQQMIASGITERALSRYGLTPRPSNSAANAAWREVDSQPRR